MKVYTVVAEETDLSELNLGLTRKGRELKRANKATKSALGDETRQMEIELLTYMKNAGHKNATPSIVKNYLKQKGLGAIGDQVVADVVSKMRGPEPVGLGGRQEPPVTRGGTPPDDPNQGTPPATGAGNTPPVPPLPGAGTPPAAGGAGNPPAGNPPAPQSIPSGTKAKLASGEEFTWLGAQWKSNRSGRMASKAQKKELNQAAGMQTNSMYEAAPGAEPTLSKRQVRAIIQQVIQKGYGQSAGFGRSRFATDQPAQADVQGMIDALKGMGYKVTK